MREITVLELEAFQRKDPVDMCLDLWARWNALADHQVSAGHGNPQDTKEFMQAGEAIEAMINGLARREWWAIRKARGICTVWIFKDEYYQDALAEALDILEPKLRMHIATRKFFD